MIKQLKTFTLRMVAGANIATVAVMLVLGNADRFDPVSHSVLSCLGLAFPVFLLINFAFLFFWLIFKFRYALIPVAGYVLAYGPVSVYMPLNIPSEVPDGDVVKVLSYNVQSYDGSPRYDNSFDMIYEYIKRSDADIVCLQEDIDTWRGTFAKYRQVYEYMDTTHVGDTALNGVGIYTRYPIIRKERIEYDSRGNGSVAYYLQRGSDTLIVINNHFESNHLSLAERGMYKTMLKGEMGRDTVREESKKLLNKLSDAVCLRAPQADAVHAYIVDHVQYPIIVCGDFNDNPISYTRRTVADGLTDCFVATGRGLGISYNLKGFFVRIDNIMCSNDLTPYNCTVDSKFDASDHYPIYCWIKMPPKR